ncbi:MAG: hypothetical protein ACXW2C_11600 [Acidimicrobiia bacterium]
MKISDLLGEGWEPDEGSERPETKTELRGSAPTTQEDTLEAANPRSSDVITSLASWAPAPEPRDPEAPAAPVSARAQLADLAAGLAIPATAPIEEAVIEAPADLADLARLELVVDDLLPEATKRKDSSRGSSRSGSRRRGR